MFVEHVVEYFGALVVVDADALLLDEVVGGGEAHLQTGGERDGTERAVRRQLHVVHLGHRRDAAHLGDTASVREVGLRHGDARLEYRQEILPGVKPLAGPDRNRGGLGELTDQVGVLRNDRFLDEERSQGFEQRGDPAGVGKREPAVKVHGHITVGAEHGARCGDPFEHTVDFGDRADPAHDAGGVHLDGGQSHGDLRRDRVGDAARVVAADPAVHADAIAHRTAEKLVDRNPERLALEVPQRLVDAGDGTAKHRSTAVEAALGQYLPVVFNAVGVGADEVFRELFDHRAHGIRMPLEAGFAPADDALAGFEPHE